MIDDEVLKHAHRVDQRATALAEDMARELRASRAAILGKLAALAADAGDNFDALPATRRKALLEAQAQAVDAVLAQVYATMGDHLEDAGQDIIGATMTTTAEALAAATGAGVVAVGTGLTLDVTRAWFESSTVDGLLVNDFLGKLQASTRDRIISAGRRAMIEGASVQRMAKMIKDQGIEASIPSLEGMARTFAMSASNYARDQIVKSKFADVVSGWRRSVVLDGRTCVVCGSMDGKQYGLNDPKPSLPSHWRCRCLYLPQAVTWRELGIDIDEFEGGDLTTVKHSARTVHHRDGSTSTKFTVKEVGKVPAGTSYEAWLKMQLDEDPAFVRSVLGKTRFELFKSGKLRLSSMVTEGRIKRLSEL